jgi:hypothetical protein
VPEGPWNVKIHLQSYKYVRICNNKLQSLCTSPFPSWCPLATNKKRWPALLGTHINWDEVSFSLPRRYKPWVGCPSLHLRRMVVTPPSRSLSSATVNPPGIVRPYMYALRHKIDLRFLDQDEGDILAVGRDRPSCGDRPPYSLGEFLWLNFYRISEIDLGWS